MNCEKQMNKLTESKKRQYIAEGNKSKWFRNLSEERKSEIVEKYMSSEFLDLKCDWAFKFVMSSPEILIILLNDFLPETVTEVVSVSTEPKRLGGTEKNVLMDVVALDADGGEGAEVDGGNRDVEIHSLGAAGHVREGDNVLVGLGGGEGRGGLAGAGLGYVASAGDLVHTLEGDGNLHRAVGDVVEDEAQEAAHVVEAQEFGVVDGHHRHVGEGGRGEGEAAHTICGQIFDLRGGAAAEQMVP